MDDHERHPGGETASDLDAEAQEAIQELVEAERAVMQARLRLHDALRRRQQEAASATSDAT